MTESIIAPTRTSTDKREALLTAALRLIARSGLHATPTAAVAREAGVAVGTLYLYFPSKDALINALYLQLLEDQRRASGNDDGPLDTVATDSRAHLWHSWHGLARWHIDHPDASRVMQQCRTSGILTDDTRAIELRARETGLVRFRESITLGLIRDLPLSAFWALYAGPIVALAEAQGEVTEDALRATFEGVCRSVLPSTAPSNDR